MPATGCACVGLPQPRAGLGGHGVGMDGMQMCGGCGRVWGAARMYGDCVWAWGGALAYGARKPMKIRGMVAECEPADFVCFWQHRGRRPDMGAALVCGKPSDMTVWRDLRTLVFSAASGGAAARGGVKDTRDDCACRKRWCFVEGGAADGLEQRQGAAAAGVWEEWRRLSAAPSAAVRLPHLTWVPTATRMTRMWLPFCRPRIDPCASERDTDMCRDGMRRGASALQAACGIWQAGDRH